VSDFDPATDAVPYEQLPLVDQWLLAQHAKVMAEVQEAYEAYQVTHSVAPAAAYRRELSCCFLVIYGRLVGKKEWAE
jgi:isoleucyl-tRNA synthetase